MLKSVLLSLLLLPMAVLAQTPESSPVRAHAWKTDAQGHAMMNRQDVEIGMPRLAPHFDEIDANRDGYLARDEIRAWHQATGKEKGKAMAKGARHDGMPQPGAKPADRFKDADKNGDGKLSKEEARAMPRIEKDFDALDADRDGQITREELRAARKAGKAKAAGQDSIGKDREGAAAQFKQADKNHDGKLWKDEAKAMPKIEKNFEAIDANKDGQVTPDEIRNFMRSPASQNQAGEQTPAQ